MMKKWICLLMAMLLFFCVGCARQEFASVPEQMPPSSEITPEEPIPVQKPREKLESRYYNEVKILLEKGGKSLIFPFHTDAEEIGQSTVTEASVLWAFKDACLDYKMNPIAGFMLMVRDGIYRKDAEKKSFYINGASDGGTEGYVFRNLTQSITPKNYPYTTAGCESLLRDMIDLRSLNDNSILLSALDHGSRHSDYAFYYSGSDHCYYTYVVIDSGSTLEVMAMYIRSNDGAVITDVEMQILSGEYENTGHMGIGISSLIRSNEETFDMVSVMSITEQLLTGSAYLSNNSAELDMLNMNTELPFAYTLGEYDVSLYVEIYQKDCERFESFSGESCRMTNYRIRKR